MLATSLSDAELFAVAKELPSAPRLLVELGQAIRNPRVESKDIVHLLRQDPAMVARLIRMANSAAYGRAEPAGSIEEAVMSVGFQEVHRLVGAVAASQISDQKLGLYGIGGPLLRENALFVAVLMEELAAHADEDPRSCYTVGLLRSIGKMALDMIGRRDPALPPFAGSGFSALDAWEQKHWGVTNCEIAERILLDWRLPSDTVISIRHHYFPEKRHNPIIHLLSLAAGSAEHRCFGLPGEEPYWKFTPENFAKAGVDSRGFQTVTERAQRTFQRLKTALG